jgi:replication factor C subunit 1
LQNKFPKIPKKHKPKPNHILNPAQGPDSRSLNERYNEFFQDYSLVPLLVQQNYIEAAKNGVYRRPGVGEGDKIACLAAAAEAASDMELAGARLMGLGEQHWELLPTQAALCVRVGSKVRGFQSYPQFPAWLGKNSTRGKRSRLTRELVHHTALSVGQGFRPMRLDYVPYLRKALLRPLLAAQRAALQGTGTDAIAGGGSGSGSGSAAEGVSEVVAMLDAYGLSKDDLSETLKELQFATGTGQVGAGRFDPKNPNNLRDEFEDLDSKTKAALTRMYNQGEHKSQALQPQIGAKRKAKAAAQAEEEGEEEEEEGEKEEIDLSAFAKKKKGGTKKVAAKKPKKTKVAK